MTDEPDAIDGDGQPLYFEDCLTVCPAEHISAAREIALWHCQNVEHQALITIDDILTTRIANVGSNVITHYVCARRIFQSEIDAEVQTLKNQNEMWISGELLELSDPQCLLTFCCLKCTLPEFLSFHNMQEAV